MRIEEEVFLDDYGMRRKKFVYDHRIHHSYVFVAGNEVYTVIVGSLADEEIFTRIGYEMPPGIEFPANGMAEVYFDVYDGMDSLADFRHVRFKGLGSAVVLQTVALALIAHYEKFNIGGFAFQAASGGVVDIGRQTTLEETYDYMLGLKSGPRYNKRTGLPKKAPRPLIPEDLHAYKTITDGRACYVVLQ
ncbi:hypothetical protein IOS36_003939 [Salmonella enterica]|nr:hypothetical protein [Salmonella enterica]EAW1477548.1 hypothetical protein [Salmonella enterica subsp. enterica]EBH8788114.1 hypothetical protein [Salmonella enterica subsp. enterica serovar Newport]ECH9224542.1 hypothetical protein [Salmonella enterica subsp. arizonae]EDQ7735400.1 hypothetical protein [Salmonella enterica subsp. enterica serovar 4,[5],12:i:-]EDX3027047.1 hypothetical protein [Salmonella enterica subsp. houtenae serovar 48:g,z51:-]MBA3158041.1 hypothetical protein [Salmon